MTDPGRQLAQIRDPAGRPVVLLARIWEQKIVLARPELVSHFDELLKTVNAPDHTEPDPRPRRRRHYRRGIGPSRWLLVVVGYEQEPARIITAWAKRKDPERWTQ